MDHHQFTVDPGPEAGGIVKLFDVKVGGPHADSLLSLRQFLDHPANVGWTAIKSGAGSPGASIGHRDCMRVARHLGRFAFPKNIEHRRQRDGHKDPNNRNRNYHF